MAAGVSIIHLCQTIENLYLELPREIMPDEKTGRSKHT